VGGVGSGKKDQQGNLTQIKALRRRQPIATPTSQEDRLTDAYKPSTWAPTTKFCCAFGDAYSHWVAVYLTMSNPPNARDDVVSDPGSAAGTQ
jgi:hypothetical protein